MSWCFCWCWPSWYSLATSTMSTGSTLTSLSQRDLGIQWFVTIILIMHVCMHTIIHAHAITTAKYLLKSMATIWIVNYSSQKQSLLHDFSHFFRGVWFFFFFFFFFFNYSIMEWLRQSWFRWKFSWQCEKWMGHVYLYNCMHYTCPMTIVTIRLGQSQRCTTCT